MAVKVAVLEQDSKFLDRLTAVFSRNYADKLEIFPFTDLELALSSLEFVGAALLLADESFRIPERALPENCALAYFVSSVGTDRLDGHRAICKFQRTELIYRQIVALVCDGGETKFLTFSSPAGGVGTSTLAAACARRLASQGKRALYLQLDPCGCPSLFFRGKGDYRFGDVLHTLRHKDANLAELLIHASRKDASGVSFFCEDEPERVPPAPDAEAISRLLRELRVIAVFDYIVVDIPFPMLLQQTELWGRSAATVLVADATQSAQLKLSRGYFALHREGLRSELCLLRNRCGDLPVSAPELPGVKLLGQIPVFEADKCLSSVAALSLFDTLI